MDFGSEPAPKGFTIHSAPGPPALGYRTSGMGCSVIFFGLWLTLWTAGCVVLTKNILSRPTKFAEHLVFFAFWFVEIAVLCFAIWYFFTRTTFIFHPDKLVVQRRLWFLAWSREFRKAAITSVQQVKDGGEDEDSFPSWGLRLEGANGGKLLWRQPIDRSAWFGPLVAQWAGVPYEPSPEQK
jgi:hypothetical protein